MIERHFLEHFKGRSVTAIGAASESRLCIKFDSEEILIITADVRKGVRPGTLGKSLPTLHFIGVRKDGKRISSEDTWLEAVRSKMKRRTDGRDTRKTPEASG